VTAIPEILETLIAQARTAAASAAPGDALRALLTDTLEDRDAMANAIAVQAEDEVLLFEHDTCSIWPCRFDPETVLPPHEHCMTVHVAVYRGTEVQVLYRREPDSLRYAGVKAVDAGVLLTLGPDAVHAVTANGEGQSHAIHIYQGPLTKVKRSLFNWTDGGAVDFTPENFHAMLRKRADVPELST
jgi:predicted metal-dependent enzyme (double-stranded beta helix superfamily)